VRSGVFGGLREEVFGERGGGAGGRRSYEEGGVTGRTSGFARNEPAKRAPLGWHDPATN